MTKISKAARIISCLILFLAFACSLAYAQTIPTGRLDGYVADESDLPLPGVSVTISSKSLITPILSGISNEKGYFRFIGLPSGSYKVEFGLSGFQTLIREGIIVTAGKATTLNIVLAQSALQETVVVEGRAPTVNIEDTSIGATFGKETLENLPVTRGVDDVANLAPGMYDESSHGSDQLTNRYSIDGQNHSHPLHGVLVNEVSFSSIEEISVETGLHKAEYGGAMGAYVQVLTKSGGNDFSGEFGIYAQQKGLQSDNTKGTPFEGKFIGFDYDYQPNFALGGPIKKDKAWFFASFDGRAYRSYVQGYPYDSSEHQAIDQPRYRPFAKITLQLDPNNKLITSASYNYGHNNHTGANQYQTTESTTKGPTWGVSLSSQWTRTVSQNFLFNVRAGYFYNMEDRVLKNDEQRVYDLATLLYTGSGGYYHTNKRGRAQLNSDASYFIDDWHGSHELKAGAEMGFAFNGSHRTFVQDPRWEGVFSDTFKVSQVYLRNGVPERLALSENYFRKEQILNAGLFLQDTWTVSKKLILNLGFRYDWQQTVWPKQMWGDSDQWAYEKRTVAMTWNTLSPRLGLSFDPAGNGKMVFKASYGRYYAAHTTMLTNIAYRGGARSMNVRLNPDWSVAYTYGYSEPTGAVDPDGLKPYYNDTINFGIEREIIRDLSFSVAYVMKWEHNIIEGVDVNHVDVAYLKEHGFDGGNGLRWTGYKEVQGVDPLNGNAVTFYSLDPAQDTSQKVVMMNIPGIGRKYQGLELKFTKRMSDNWSMLTSYVWSRGEGLFGTNRFDSDGASNYFNEPNIHVNAWGRLQHQREHVLKMQGSYFFPLGIQLSAQYTFATGVPYCRELRSSEAGASLYQGTVTIKAEGYDAYTYPSTHDLNLRLEKAFNVGPGRLSIIADVFQALNANTTISYGLQTAVNWQRVLGILDPRYVRLGVLYRF